MTIETHAKFKVFNSYALYQTSNIWEVTLYVLNLNVFRYNLSQT